MAHKLRAAGVLSLAAGLGAAMLWCLMPTAAQAQKVTDHVSSSTPSAAPRAAGRPAWTELTPAQQQSLAPLAGQWNTLSEVHRRKWLRIAARYQKLSPAEQQRVHDRMEEWVKLTPEQRRLARENFQIHRTIPADRKAEAWDRYQQLSEAQKRELAAAETVAPRPGAVSALPSGRKLPTRSHRAAPDSPATAASGKHLAASAPAAPMAVGAASAPAAAAASSVMAPAGATTEAMLAPGTTDSARPAATGAPAVDSPTSSGSAPEAASGLPQ